MAYAFAAFIICFAAIVGGIIAFWGYFKELKKKGDNKRRSWIRDHFGEIQVALSAKGYTISDLDQFGRKRDPMTSMAWFVISNESTGQQTRKLNIREFYDVMQDAMTSKNLDSVFFKKYLYRQFRVK